MNVATAKVFGEIHRRDRNGEFLQFLRTSETSVPEVLDIRLVMDNYGTQKTGAIKRWFAALRPLNTAI